MREGDQRADHWGEVWEAFKMPPPDSIDPGVEGLRALGEQMSVSLSTLTKPLLQ